jgi:hypothetical protein
MCRIVASRLCTKGHTTRMEYIGGCSALPSGERLRLVSVGTTVSSEARELVDLSPLSSRFGGRARFISGLSEVRDDAARKDEADDLSDRKLDCPVSAALVSDCSELPEESDGEFCQRSEADELSAGDLIELRSDEMLDTRLICVFPVMEGNVGFCNGEPCTFSGGTGV